MFRRTATLGLLFECHGLCNLVYSRLMGLRGLHVTFYRYYYSEPCSLEINSLRTPMCQSQFFVLLLLFLSDLSLPVFRLSASYTLLFLRFYKLGCDLYYVHIDQFKIGFSN